MLVVVAVVVVVMVVVVGRTRGQYWLGAYAHTHRRGWGRAVGVEVVDRWGLIRPTRCVSVWVCAWVGGG